MSLSTDGGVRLGAVSSGWAVAALIGFLISPLLRLLYGLFTGAPLERGELTTTVAIIAVVSGFLAYLVGGYVAATMAGYAGGTHGVLTAVFGVIVGILLVIVLALFDAVLVPSGVGMPPANFGLAGAALVVGLILFLANLFGGFVGGKLGEPSRPRAER